VLLGTHLRRCFASHPFGEQRLGSIGQADDEEDLLVLSYGADDVCLRPAQRMEGVMDSHPPNMSIM
jgi:hypothetical protein